ncbi:hypothetical protein HMN09_00457500 [Mycena chlorophos]|uniref:Uncharacterized protein n=1 Tax=Mycena chlorophos TaxID=658473 RepID=A0A8H6THB5_MYCCL|nr:hypothetical protein HMN09_00457500 [Mycena chlorophos]
MFLERERLRGGVGMRTMAADQDGSRVEVMISTHSGSVLASRLGKPGARSVCGAPRACRAGHDTVQGHVCFLLTSSLCKSDFFERPSPSFNSRSMSGTLPQNPLASVVGAGATATATPFSSSTASAGSLPPPPYSQDVPQPPAYSYADPYPIPQYNLNTRSHHEDSDCVLASGRATGMDPHAQQNLLRRRAPHSHPDADSD